MLRSATVALSDMSERAWAAQVTELARTLGYQRSYHTFDSRRSSSGFPDLVLVRDRIVYAELKTAKGKLSAEQSGWLDALAQAGGEAYLWRPADLDEVAKVLGKRWRWSAYNRSLQADGQGWTPSTLWITSRDSQEAA